MGSLAELRNLFQKRLEEGIPIPPGLFHPKDLERIQDDEYLKRIMAHSKNDLESSSKLLWNIMKWRKMVGASDVNEENINMDYINTGTFFPHGRDIDGCKLLIFKCKNYSRSRFEFNEVKKIFLYWLDRVEREERGGKVTLFFDLEDASLSNFDIELIKYLIDCFYHYPGCLAKIVVYQLPWLLSATFKITKKLLPPEAVEIMRLASKDNVLKEIVSPDQALTSWGGKDNYEFRFIPEKKTTKRVSFATTRDRPESIISNMAVSIEDPAIKNHHNDISEEILAVDPTDKIVFENRNEEIVGYVKITNTTEKPAAFKIRTTGPEKFWVRPSSGVLAPKTSERISVTILPGYEKTAPRDRFLIMAIQVDINKNKIDQTDVTEAWRITSKTDVEEHRLKCSYIENVVQNHNTFTALTNNDVKEMTDSTKTTLEELKKDVNSLKSRVAEMKKIQYLSLVLLTVLLGILLFKNE